MVTLQRLHITAPPRKSILPSINGRETLRLLASTSIYENPLTIAAQRLLSAIFTVSRAGYRQVPGKPNSIMITSREVVISKLNDKSRSLKFNKGLALEVHYCTPDALFKNKPFDAWLNITYRNLKQEVPFVYDEVKILEVVDFLLEHRLPFQEHKNGERALRGKELSRFEARKVDVDLNARW